MKGIIGAVGKADTTATTTELKKSYYNSTGKGSRSAPLSFYLFMNATPWNKFDINRNITKYPDMSPAGRPEAGTLKIFTLQT